MARLPRPARKRLTPLALAHLAAALAVGCREAAVSYYEVPHEEPVTSTSLAMMPPEAMPSTNDATSAPSGGGAQLEWDKPDAWEEQPASAMRRASYRFTAPDGAEADISITVFPDAAGGLLANVNRWRGQVGLPPVAEADLADTAVPTRIAGQVGWRVDFAGTPQGGSEPLRIIGAIVPVSGSAWFFKMMGPEAVVASQREAFDQLVASIRAVVPSGGGAPAAAAGTGAGPAPSAATMPDDDVHAVVNRQAGSAPAPDGMPGMAGNVPAPPRPAGFSFVAPDGWQPQPTTPFRVVNFHVPGEGVPAAEFYVTPLSGAAGGELANVNRWRGQLGLPPVDEAGLAELSSTIEGPAGTFKVFELASSGPALKTGEPARMLAAILVRGGTSWFFRLMGESDHVAAQRGNFEAFLRSVNFEDAP